jgi:arylsulfatase A-like enzyme
MGVIMNTLITSLKSLLLGLCLAQVLSAGDKPNILYIFTDDQSDRTVSSYERSLPWVNTPNIDQLAASGVRFKSAYTGSWCMPSRATFLTGHLQYGVESMSMEGQYPSSSYDPEQCPFWMRTFKEAGYTTAQIGKWHTGVDAGYGRDWDFQIVWNRPRHPENSGAYYSDQMLSFNGGEPVMTPGYTTDNYTEWAVEYLEGKGRDPDKPWLLWMCYGATHGPFTPADRHKDTIPEDTEVPKPVDLFPPRPGKPEYVKNRAGYRRGENGTAYVQNRPGNGWEHQEGVITYQETAQGLDDAVGTLVETLKATGQLENTMIIYTSDQGFAWGQHGFQHKVAPYDANIASPFIVSYPGFVPEGKVSSTPIGGHDLVPTLFHYAGVDLPWKMHGRNLAPLLENPEEPSDHSVLLAFTGRTYGSDTSKLPKGVDSHADVPWWVSYRVHEYKYIMNLIEGEVEELYNLERDPDELHNLALDPGHADVLSRLRKAAIAEMVRTDCPFVDKIPLKRM